MEEQKLFEEVRRIISEIIEVDVDQIKSETKFREDLEVDSMKALEILVAIERKYKIKIPESRLRDIRTLKDSVNLTSEFISK